MKTTQKSVIISFKLFGLSCEKCVKKVKELVENEFGLTLSFINKCYMTLSVNQDALNSHQDALIQKLIQKIHKIGFKAQYLTSCNNTSHQDLFSDEACFYLSGLTCNQCVLKLKNTLGHYEDIQIIEATPYFLRIKLIRHSNLHTFHQTLIDTIIDSIEQTGFNATYCDPNQVKLIKDNKDEHKDKNVKGINTTSDLKSNSPCLPNPQINSQTKSQEEIKSVFLQIEGMTCASCVSNVEKVLSQIPLIKEYSVNLALKKVTISSNEEGMHHAISSLKTLGYNAHIQSHHKSHLISSNSHCAKQRQKLFYQAVLGLCSAFILMAYGFLDTMLLTESNRLFWFFVGVICLVLIIFTGPHFYKNAFSKLKHWQFNMDSLVVLGVSSAWVYSFTLVLFPQIISVSERHIYFEASIMILGLINLGRYLEMKAKNYASQSLLTLMNLVPDKATIVTESGDKPIDIDQILPDMVLRLRIGDKVPVDGVITEGYITIDESLLTGEPVAVEGSKDNKVFAGTIVISGSALIKVTGIGQQTALSGIIEAIEKAQSSKPPLAKIADKISGIFVPLVLMIALFTAIIWGLLGPEPKLSYIIVTTISVLVIACPCALGLAIPMSIITSVGRAASMGVLIRDANVLESAKDIDTLIFDKTGTLTEGEPLLSGIILNEEFYPNKKLNSDDKVDLTSQEIQFQALALEKLKLLYIAKLLETQTNHPLAKSIINGFDNSYADYCKQYAKPQLTSFEVNEVHTYIGLGISGLVNNKRWYLGNLELLQTRDIKLPKSPETLATINENQKKGVTVIFLASEKKCHAILFIKDKLKENISEVFKTLNQTYQTWLISGDNALSAQTIATSLGILNVIANAKPEDKANTIIKLQSQGRKVAMIGDGINDTIAMATADLSVAMGKGSDIAKQTADFILLNNQLNKLSAILKLAKSVQLNMKQNLFFAFIYNILLIPIAAGILYPFNGVLFNPMFSALAMMLSSLTVVMNANRLLKNKLE